MTTWVYVDNSTGKLGSAIAEGATSIDLGADPGWPTLEAGQAIKLVVNPPSLTQINEFFEIMYVTAYTEGDTTASGVVRGQDGTSDIGHARYASWVAGPVASDFGGGGGGGGPNVTDGTHTVDAPTEISFGSPATVSNPGGGVALVSFEIPSPPTVTDGTTYVDSPGLIKVSGATVSNPSSGVAEVTIEVTPPSVTDGVTTVAAPSEIRFSGANVTNPGGGEALVTVAGLAVTDGTHTEDGVTTISVSGATVGSGGSGIADVTIEGSSLEVTDGTHTETGVTTLTFDGATVGTTGSGEATVTITGGGGGSGSPVAARAYRSAGLALVANTWTKVPLDTLSFDTGANMDVTTNGRFDCPVTGIYGVQVNAAVAADGGYQAVGIYKNGSMYSLCPLGTNGVNSLADTIPCNAGDYLELWALSTTEGSIYVTPSGIEATANSQFNFLAVSLIG